MQLAEFNAAPADEAAAVVRRWADIPVWVDAIVAARPFDEVDELAAEAGLLSSDWDADDLDRVLAQHPSSDTQDLGAGTAIGDRAAVYEERFGRVFLVRAAGRTPEQVLAELDRRLALDPATETDEALRQLAEIAVLRLRTDIEETP